MDPERRLTASQLAVARGFQSRIRHQPDNVWAAYRELPDAKGGRYINVDLARHLCAEYAGAGLAPELLRRTRTALTPASYLPAKTFCDAVFASWLDDRACVQRVWFTAGGPASGKSAAMRRFIAPEPGAVVYDTSFANLQVALALIRSCGHRPVDVLFAAADFELAMHDMLDRAMRPGLDFGRYISALRMARLHHGAISTILALADAQQRDDMPVDRVSISCYSQADDGPVALDRLRAQSMTTIEERIHAAYVILEQRRPALPGRPLPCHPRHRRENDALTVGIHGPDHGIQRAVRPPCPSRSRKRS